jgi:hypothetical protein
MIIKGDCLGKSGFTKIIYYRKSYFLSPVICKTILKYINNYFHVDVSYCYKVDMKQREEKENILNLNFVSSINFFT